MKLSWKKIIFGFLTFGLVIAFLEFGLMVAAIISPEIDLLLSPTGTPNRIPQTIPDKRLGYRPNPEYPGNDNKGFRNPSVPDKVEIVALGDSQTYGENVRSEDAWPRQLEFLTGTSVYSMAYGGYGPTHSLILLEEALNLKPNIIIEALYSGNDLFDSFNMVYNQGQIPELKNTDTKIVASVKKAEDLESIMKRISRIYRMGATGNHKNSIWAFLSRYSRLYGLLSGAYKLYQRNHSVAWENAKAFAEAN